MMQSYTIKELLNDHQTGHSEFQDDYLITVKAGGTIYGQYKQALRELYRRIRGLREVLAQVEIDQISIEEQDHNAKEDSFKGRKAVIRSRLKSMRLEEADRAIENTKREANRFYQQACVLKDQIGDLTPEKRDELDREMWIYRVREMLALDILTIGRPSSKTYEMFTAMPFEMKKGLIKYLTNGKQKEVADWYLARHDKEFDVDASLPEPIKQIDFTKI